MQIPVIPGTWRWEGRQENCNVGPVSRKEVKEMKKKKKKLMLGESSVYHHMGEVVKKPGHCLFSLMFPPEPVGDEEILLCLHSGSSRTRQCLCSQKDPFLTDVGLSTRKLFPKITII